MKFNRLYDIILQEQQGGDGLQQKLQQKLKPHMDPQKDGGKEGGEDGQKKEDQQKPDFKQILQKYNKLALQKLPGLLAKNKKYAKVPQQKLKAAVESLVKKYSESGFIASVTGDGKVPMYEMQLGKPKQQKNAVTVKYFEKRMQNYMQSLKRIPPPKKEGGQEQEKEGGQEQEKEGGEEQKKEG